MKRPVSESKRSQRARAVERGSARRAGWLRLARTIVLGTIAAVAGIIWLGEQYGIERSVMLEFLGTSALFVLLLAGTGLVGVAVLIGIRRLLGRS